MLRELYLWINRLRGDIVTKKGWENPLDDRHQFPAYLLEYLRHEDPLFFLKLFLVAVGIAVLFGVLLYLVRGRWLNNKWIFKGLLTPRQRKLHYWFTFVVAVILSGLIHWFTAYSLIPGRIKEEEGTLDNFQELREEYINPVLAREKHASYIAWSFMLFEPRLVNRQACRPDEDKKIPKYQSVMNVLTTKRAKSLIMRICKRQNKGCCEKERTKCKGAGCYEKFEDYWLREVLAYRLNWAVPITILGALYTAIVFFLLSLWLRGYSTVYHDVPF